ncbi:MAG: urea ABC transporter permease subunit UrtB [Nitrospirae bacterium]|nr:MAG: urea ABC transporter permease subunit UrtB [Nitrospirota bacterium]
MKKVWWIVVLAVLCGSVVGVWAEEPAQTAPSTVSAMIDEALKGLASEDAAVQEAAVQTLITRGDAGLLPKLEAMRAEGDRSLRMAIKPVLDLLKNKTKLTSQKQEDRRSAAADLATTGNPMALVWLEAALPAEQDRWVRYQIEESIGLIKLADADPALKAAAATKLGELHSQNAVPALKELAGSSTGSGQAPSAIPGQEQAAGSGSGDQAPGQALVAKAAAEAIERIETWSSWTSAIETLFRGISLSSVLLLMALGLAIIFGLMGVINMAHGEFMMLGAYATFLTQEGFKAWLPPGLFDYYFLLAMPCSFLAAGLFGLLLEASLIRFLYGRPLETLLATWGVSLILIQGARVVFGDLTSVVAPSWLSGGMQLMVGVQLPYNRMFIIGLASVCVLGIYFLLFRTGVGLKVRAVMQNRNMSACLAIPTRKVDAYTFAFGSGLAGLAGCALTLIGNVEPGLGQNYIVDSFMVVVTGGVGKLAGTIVASLGIGGLNKLLEPSFGAVYGKVFILVLVILFLQWRPSGLFTIKGRHVES